MSATKIEWADKSWNPVIGCTKVSPGCANCYAKRMAERFAGPWGLDPANPFAVKLHPERLEDPLRWKKPSTVFVCSMSDLFHEDIPDKYIVDVLSTIAECQFSGNRHTFLLLTKRAGRMQEIMSGETIANDVWLQTTHGVSRGKSPWPLANVWTGVTVENQEQADKRIPFLLATPAAKRFVSVEPMLGPVDLGEYMHVSLMKSCKGDWWTKHGINGPALDWVICGGESGPNARPMHPDWARSLRDQCKASGTPFMFKQWGEWAPYLDIDLKEYNFSRVGKKAAGRLLDGELWDQYPEGGNN